MEDDPLTRLTEILVDYVLDCLADYPDVRAVVADDDEEFRGWLARGPAALARPGPPELSIGVCAASSLSGPLARALHQVCAHRAVLVVCDCQDVAPRLVLEGAGFDVVQVRKVSEIAGAVAEATAGDLPLVLDVQVAASDVGPLQQEPARAGR